MPCPDGITKPCFDNFFKDGVNCVRNCPVGFYGDITDFTCKACNASCTACFGPAATDCKNKPAGCSGTEFKHNDTCVATCPDGFFENAATKACEACGVNCKTCTSNAICTLCNSNFYLNNSICVSTCPDGTFIVQNKLFYSFLKLIRIV